MSVLIIKNRHILTMVCIISVPTLIQRKILKHIYINVGLIAKTIVIFVFGFTSLLIDQT